MAKKLTKYNPQKCLVNSPEGVEALKAQVRLFREKATDAAGSVWDFPNGNIAMMIMAPCERRWCAPQPKD